MPTSARRTTIADKNPASRSRTRFCILRATSQESCGVLPSNNRAPLKNGIRKTRHENFGLTPENLRTLRALKTPAQIQKFIDALPYQYANTAWSPQRVLRERKGHCLEGALLAAAALRVNGHPPLLMDLEAVHDDDHVLALYREGGLWGSIAKSNFAGLRFRAPIYRTLRELALSYFEHYYNLRGERTLRSYSRPVNLARLDAPPLDDLGRRRLVRPGIAHRGRGTTRSSPTRWRAPCHGSTAAASKQECTAGRNTEGIACVLFT